MMFYSPDETFAQKQAAYDSEFRRLVRNGLITDRELSDWAHHDLLDREKFAALAKAWDAMQAAYPLTTQGKAEAANAAGDSPMVQLPQADDQPDRVDPVDSQVLAHVQSLGAYRGPVPVLPGVDEQHFLTSFRRVRERLEGLKAYEVLNDGKLGIEVVA